MMSGDPLINLIPEALLEKAYDDVVSRPAKQLGLLAEDTMKVLRLLLFPLQIGAAFQERLERACARIAGKVPEERMTSPPPEILGPVLEGMRYLDDENPLWRMFEELLTKSCDRENIELLHPAFPRILSQLSRDEAVILYLLRSTSFKVTDQLDADDEKKQFINRRVLESTLPRDELFVPENIELYYSHLESLNLVMWPVLSQEAIHDSNGKQTGLMRHSEMLLTEFGKFFVNATVPQEGFRSPS